MPAASSPPAVPPAKPETTEQPAPPAVVRMPKPTPAPPPPKIVGHGTQGYKLPSATLLRPPEDAEGIDEDELKERAARLTAKFLEFGVTGSVTQIHPGPVVTTFEFKPEAGIKYSRITNLVDDLCLAMKAESILIDRIAGKSTVGIEVPNLRREIIHLRELVESNEFLGSTSRLSLGLGKDVTGKIRIGELTQMPHLLIAGSTGSGKSVAINSMVVSILMKSTPEEVKLILIDPKRLELNLYDGVPHLLTPIVTEPKRAANALRRAVMEMDDRLRKLAEHGVRNIGQYNKLFEPESTLNLFDNNGERERPLPYIVIIIDELADLMMVEPQGVEESITRLAQMARAVGIHLVLATQRPSVDVITGLDQSQHAVPHVLPRRFQGGFAHHPGFQRRGSLAGTRRHALPAACKFSPPTFARGADHRSGDREGGQLVQNPVAASIQRGIPGTHSGQGAGGRTGG